MNTNTNQKDIVIICVGTTSVIGDSLGPKVGDLLINCYNIDAFVYGSSIRPVNGINYASYLAFVKKHHKNSVIIAIDACLGEKKEIGKVKYTFEGLRAGAALNKNLEKIGDIAILGIVAKKSENNFNSLNLASESTIDLLSQKIALRVFHLTNILLKKAN